jgi:protease I
MSKKVLIPLPSFDFDPTECSIPWKLLKDHGVEVTFATPDGAPAVCDQKMLNGNGLWIFTNILKADTASRKIYEELKNSTEFQTPKKWSEIDSKNYDGVILPGGHAKGMKEYLESKTLQNVVSEFFSEKKPVGAICHGVVLVARSIQVNGKSVLFGRKTTALLGSQELSAWMMTCLWLGSYYRTYPETVEAEVKSNLSSPKDFIKGSLPLRRDHQDKLGNGFTVIDGNYVSARWPGDAHKFSKDFLGLLNKKAGN